MPYDILPYYAIIFYSLPYHIVLYLYCTISQNLAFLSDTGRVVHGYGAEQDDCPGAESRFVVDDGTCCDMMRVGIEWIHFLTLDISKLPPHTGYSDTSGHPQPPRVAAVRHAR